MEEIKYIIGQTKMNDISIGTLREYFQSTDYEHGIGFIMDHFTIKRYFCKEVSRGDINEK